MGDCTEEKLEMEQPDEVYTLGRALRDAHQPGASDQSDGLAILLEKLDPPAGTPA